MGATHVIEMDCDFSHDPKDVRRMLAEMILERDHIRKSAARQAKEKIRRQKRRRSRRQREKMLAEKHAHSEKKALRRPVADEM